MSVCGVIAVAVVVAFVACWAPFHAQRLLTIYTRDDQWTDALLETQSLLFYVSGTPSYFTVSVSGVSRDYLSSPFLFRSPFQDYFCCLQGSSLGVVADGRL